MLTRDPAAARSEVPSNRVLVGENRPDSREDRRCGKCGKLSSDWAHGRLAYYALPIVRRNDMKGDKLQTIRRGGWSRTSFITLEKWLRVEY